MRGVFQVTGQDIRRLFLPDSHGGNFRAFLNTVISAHAGSYGLPISDLHFNVRDNYPDEGVDTVVDSGIQQDPSGWMEVPTSWQFKATAETSLNEGMLRKEMTKDYSKTLIEKGYGYRFCVSDDFPQRKEEYVQYLTEEARKINASAREPMVLTASDIANWANLYPARILQFFPNRQIIGARDYKTWEKEITIATPHYVAVDAWSPVRDRIIRHATFTEPIEPQEILLEIQGESGVGKTRMVYEAIQSVGTVADLTIYVNENHEEIAGRLVSDTSVHAIVVADECDASTRVALRRRLEPFTNRIRVIAVDNTGQRDRAGRALNWLNRMSEQDGKEVLQKNFAAVPENHRRAYVSMCQGFIGLAADMCRHHGSFSSEELPSSVRDYYKNRLQSDEERKVVEALSLVEKVGFARDVSYELDNLCSHLKLDRNLVQERSNRLHNTPGFVRRAGRFFYVTPDVIARLAFEDAWLRWVRPDPKHFLENFPADILPRFQERVRSVGTVEAREAVESFFLDWANALNSQALATHAVSERLCTLVEISPERYLPIFRTLVDESSNEELHSQEGESYRGWRPRRNLVWLCERLAQFPEYFNDVEEILLRLALAESELSIGNNATGIWKQLYRIHLSGTAVPFMERLPRLKDRILSDDEAESCLALDALADVFDPYGSRILGPAVVAGRIPPADWAPTGLEIDDCIRASLRVVGELINGSNERLKQGGMEVLFGRFRTLIYGGFLQELQGLIRPEIVGDEARARAVIEIEEHLHLERLSTKKDRIPASLLSQVEKWVQSLSATDFHGKLLTALKAKPWRAQYHRPDEWRRELRGLAETLLSDAHLLQEELEHLFSAGALSSPHLGEELGKLDIDGSLVETILGATCQRESVSFAAGYIAEVVLHPEVDLVHVNALLDKIEDLSPTVAFELYQTGKRKTKAFERTFRLVDSGKLPIEYLRAFSYGHWSQEVTHKEIAEVLRRLVDARDAGAINAGEIALQLISFKLFGKVAQEKEVVSEDLNSLVWTVLELTAANPGRESHWWGEALDTLSDQDNERATKLAASALLEEHYEQRDTANQVLQKIARKDPELVMKHLGQQILDQERGWRFNAGKFPIVLALPDDVVIAWVESNGIEAARRIARHIPSPHLDTEGNPVIPKLTHYVLEIYETDDRVFNEFLAGRHNLQGYVGDIAAVRDKEAELARRFLKHNLRRIRDWATAEIQEAKAEAAWWRRQNEEDEIR